MKKQIDISQEQQPTLSEKLNEHPLLNWINDNTKNLLYILVIVACLGVLAYRVLNYWSSQTGYNYVVAENDFADLHAQNGEEFEATANSLISTINSQQDLQPIYDGKLAQLLLVKGDVSQAEPLINRALGRTREDSGPLYNRYVETTVLIAKQDYPEALQQANDLHQYLVGNPDEAGPNLLAMNMLRRAMLQKQLGLTEEESMTWFEWRQYASGEKVSGQSEAGFQRVRDAFREGKINLNNYIEAREKLLK